MRAYRVTKVIGITYNRRQIVLPIEVKGIQTLPLWKLEEKLYREISQPDADDPIVKLRIITKDI